METLRHNLREFLFGNFQIGFKSQRFLYKASYKASCMELGTPHEIQPYLFSQTRIQIWEWRRERFWTDQIPYTKLCSLFDVTLSIRASLFFSSFCLCCVCVIALFLYFRLSLCFFFFSFVCPPSIYRLQRSCSLIFLSTDQIMEQFSSVFFPP